MKKKIFISILTIISSIFIFFIAQNIDKNTALGKGEVCNDECSGCLCEGNQGNIIMNKRTKNQSDKSLL